MSLSGHVLSFSICISINWLQQFSFAHQNVKMFQCKKIKIKLKIRTTYGHDAHNFTIYDGYFVLGSGSTMLNEQCTVCKLQVFILLTKCKDFQCYLHACHASWFECTNLLKIIFAQWMCFDVVDGVFVLCIEFSNIDNKIEYIIRWHFHLKTIDLLCELHIGAHWLLKCPLSIVHCPGHKPNKAFPFISSFHLSPLLRLPLSFRSFRSCFGIFSHRLEWFCSNILMRYKIYMIMKRHDRERRQWI